MSTKDSEYKELFYLEAHENCEELSKLFTDLEKDHSDTNAINSIFRITHTLKGNAMAMGFEDIAGLSHVMEDVFVEIKKGKVLLNVDLFNSLFKANDKLGGLIEALKTNERVSYLGIKTKLAVYLKNLSKSTAPGAGKDAEPDKEATFPNTTENNFVEIDEHQQNDNADSPETSESTISFTDVIQIPVRKLDELMNLVGELIIERDRLIAVTGLSKGSRTTEFEGLKRITSNLQYNIMNARMVKTGFLFNKFHRVTRDVATIEKKTVNLVIKGSETEIDRNILKIMSDSLIHLVRNAVSHGIETPELRRKKRKPEGGTVILNAKHEKDNVIIQVTDDGVGIDPELIREKIVQKGLVSQSVAANLTDQQVVMYIFEAGFSNAEKVSEISGRGVGMDVVKRASESIGGHVSVDSEPGHGTTVNLVLPSSMALKAALLFELGSQEYAIALSYTEAVISIPKNEIHKISNGLMAQYLESTIPIVFLQDLIQAEDLTKIYDDKRPHKTFDSVDEMRILDVIVILYSGRMIGMVVDKLLQQKEIFEKTLSKPLDKIKLLSGTTILGTGKVCPVIDAAAVMDVLYKSNIHGQLATNDN